jgi:hypothetical protein
MELVEAELELGVPGLLCALTVHEHSILIHLSGGSGEASLFFPTSIPYADLVLEGGDAAQPGPGVAPSAPFKRL